MTEPAPPGWVWCPGEGQLAEFVSRGPGKAVRWWRCPVCRWVGFDTRTDDPFPVGHHLARP